MTDLMAAMAGSGMSPVTHYVRYGADEGLDVTPVNEGNVPDPEPEPNPEPTPDPEPNPEPQPDPVLFSATEGRDAVTFHDGAADTFVTQCGSAVLEQQLVRMEFLNYHYSSGIMAVDGKVVLDPLVGSMSMDLGGFYAMLMDGNRTGFAGQLGRFPDGWTVARGKAGADPTSYDHFREMIFTATSDGDKDLLEVVWCPKGALEAQGFEFSEDPVLGVGESLYVNGTSVYTNTAATPISLSSLATPGQFLDLGVVDGMRLYIVDPVTGTSPYFPGGKPGLVCWSVNVADHPPLTVTYGDARTPIPQSFNEDGGNGEAIPWEVTEIVKGGTTLSTSSLGRLDAITDFNPAEDRIDLPEAVGALHKGGVLQAINDIAFSAVAGSGSGQVGANEAGLFKYGSDHYLFVNDGDASFNTETDIVIQLVGFSDADAAAMTVGNFV